MMLAYLYDHKGEKTKSAALWASVEGKPLGRATRISSRTR
jgi:hypothetical protein